MEAPDTQSNSAPSTQLVLIRAALVWIIVGSGIRGYMIGVGASARWGGEPLMARLAFVHGFATDLVLFSLTAAPLFGLAHLLSRHGRRWFRQAAHVGFLGLLSIHTLVLLLNVFAFELTENRLNFTVLDVLADPQWFEHVQRYVGGTAILVVLLVLTLSSPWALHYLLGRMVRRSPNWREQLGLAVLWGLGLFFFAGVVLRSHTTAEVSARFTTLALRNYGHPCVEELLGYWERSERFQIPVYLSPSDLQELRACLLPGDGAPAYDDELPLHRRWSHGERPRLIEVTETDERLNLVVILLESTGAGDIGAFGFPGGHTPVFDALAEEGLLFERFYANACLSFPALFSIFMSGYTEFSQQGRHLAAAVGRGNLASVLLESGYTGGYLGETVLGCPGVDHMVEEVRRKGLRRSTHDDRVLFSSAADWAKVAERPYAMFVFTDT
ncbi:sulfatase-like hydrolase/transferase, partial [Planctomycetota bacterium]